MTNDTRKDLLKTHPRAVVHLRSQVVKKRFGLVLGAGISVDLGVPMWKSLVTSIASDSEIDGKAIICNEVGGRTLPYQSELLFQHLSKKMQKELDPSLSELAKQSTIQAKWAEICAKHIYAKTPTDIEKALSDHVYFKSLLPLIRTSYLTITFNFDDFLERALTHTRPGAEKTTGLGYESVTDPWPQFRRTQAVIYHPHGVVPDQGRLMETPVDRFVFSEAAYSAQYVGSRGHDSSFLLSHFARNTCLIIGCALEEELRNVLMRSAQINPGNYHYYIHFIDTETSGPDSAQRELMHETNFNVYNLITLFLTREKIKAFLDLINSDEVSDESLDDLSKMAGSKLKYTYYLTGPIGVGKSTTASLLRSLNVLDEWVEARPAILAKPWDELNEEEKKQADEWIVTQFGLKNKNLRHSKSGLSIVDRPPLDPLMFTPIDERPNKAKALLDSICPGRTGWNVEEGVVIALQGDPEVLTSRVRATGRTEYTKDRLNKMQQAIDTIYVGEGVKKINTCNLPINEVTKRVAKIIHCDQYVPFDLHGVLSTLEKGGDGAV